MNGRWLENPAEIEEHLEHPTDMYKIRWPLEGGAYSWHIPVL